MRHLNKEAAVFCGAAVTVGCHPKSTLTQIPKCVTITLTRPPWGRSREASLGWGGPEERAEDAALILPGRSSKADRLRGSRGRQACRTRATRGSTWRSLR